MVISGSNLYINKRLLAVLFLGFASGLPLALTGSTLQAWFTQSHISLMAIGSISLLGIPYTFKFLWAPLMDHFRIPWLGRRKGWILLAQLGLIATLLLLAQLDPARETKLMMIIAFIVAFLAASQDIAIDAYRTDVLNADERGLGAAYFVFTYRIAALFAGGLALVAADYIGWKLTYELMALFILLSMLPAYKAPNANEQTVPAGSLFKTIMDALTDILQRDKIWLLLLFIVFYKFGAALAMSLMTNFLLKGLGFTLMDVGLVYKSVSFIATVLGAFVGGAILLRWNLYRALLLFGLAQAFSNLAFVVLAMAGKQYVVMATTIFIENFCSGLSTAAFFAFLMSICNHRYTASQYAIFSAVDSLGRVFLGPVAALIVANFGWLQLYVWSFVLSFPGIIFLLLLKDKVAYRAHEAAH